MNIVRVSAITLFLTIGLVAHDVGRRTPAALLAQATAAWLDLDWTYRIPITAHPDSIEGTGNFADFPLVLVLDSGHSQIFQNAKSDGSDLVLTQGDGVTVLDHELVSYNPSLQKAELWFKANSFSKTENTFYIYYGNPNASVSPVPGSVWDAKYVAVYHFEEDPGQGTLLDYGPRGNHGTTTDPRSQWTSSDVTDGQIGQGWNFNGTTHYIDGDAVGTPDTSFVISAWVKLTTNTTDFAFQANPGFWAVSAQLNEVHRRPNYIASNPNRDLRWDPHPIPYDDLFHCYTWVFDGEADTILFYFDGDQQPATPWALDPGLEHFYTGHPVNPNQESPSGAGILGPMHLNTFDIMDGAGDEFRLRERILSGDWIKTEYRNQRDPGGFNAFGSQEDAGSVPVRLLSFSGKRRQSEVVLKWEVAAGSGDQVGFHVHREITGTRDRLTDKRIYAGPEYTFVDEYPPEGSLRYWLDEAARDGSVSWHGPAVIDPAPSHTLPYLFQNRPNPFQTATEIRFRTAERGHARLRIFDVRGREVARLLDGEVPSGIGEITWDGQDSNGIRVSRGIYFYRLDTREGSSTRKLVLLP
jgi:hypothetical protein